MKAVCEVPLHDFGAVSVTRIFNRQRKKTTLNIFPSLVLQPPKLPNIQQMFGLKYRTFCTLGHTRPNGMSNFGVWPNGMSNFGGQTDEKNADLKCQTSEKFGLSGSNANAAFVELVSPLLSLCMWVYRCTRRPKHTQWVCISCYVIPH